MPGISISSGLSNATVRPNPHKVPVPPAAVLTATIAPATSRLYAGQSVGAMAGFSAMTSPANFTSSAGTIASVAVDYAGDASNATSPLAEGATVSFAVTVTDSKGNRKTFTTLPIVVEYKVRIVTTSGNQVRIDINPLVPPTDTVSITISGGTVHDGIYANIPVSAFAADAPPYNFAGTVKVTHAGPVADLTAGSVMTHDDGLWATSTGKLTLTRQAQENAANISGATGPTYALAAAQLGKAYGLRVTASDGVHAPVVTNSPSIAVPAALSMTATIAPATSRLYDGQSVSAMAGFSAMTSPANFTSSAGTIASVAVDYAGDASNATSPLAEGATVSFAVTVTDSKGNRKTFTTFPVTVEYKMRITRTVGNEASIDINPIVPGTDTVSITISGGTGHDGTYPGIPVSVFAADAPPYNFAGTVRVTHAGPVADLTTGSVMIHDDGLWATSTGSLTLTRQAQSNAIDISGATGATHALAVPQLGKTYRLKATANDGVNAPVLKYSAPSISIPAAIVTQLVPELLAQFTSATRSTNTTINIAGAKLGETIYGFMSARMTSGGSLNSFLVDGVPATLIAKAGGTTASQTLAFSFSKPVNDTPNFTYAAVNTIDVQDMVISLYRVPGATTVVGTKAENIYSGSDIITSVNTVANGAVLAQFFDANSNATISVTGVNATGGVGKAGTTGITSSAGTTSQRDWATGSTQITTAETPRLVKFTQSTGGSANFVSAIAISLS